MNFYAGRIISHPAMHNPTLVVITDCNDLDDQLFGTFARCHELLRQAPVQAEDRAGLRERLQVAAGGVVFTTIQKFMHADEDLRYLRLSDRRNIIVGAAPTGAERHAIFLQQNGQKKAASRAADGGVFLHSNGPAPVL